MLFMGQQRSLKARAGRRMLWVESEISPTDSCVVHIFPQLVAIFQEAVDLQEVGSCWQNQVTRSGPFELVIWQYFRLLSSSLATLVNNSISDTLTPPSMSPCLSCHDGLRAFSTPSQSNLPFSHLFRQVFCHSGENVMKRTGMLLSSLTP